MFGIDLEPNRVEDRLEAVLVHNCTFGGNVGGGIMMGLHKLAGFGQPPVHNTSITIRGCTIDGTGPVVRANGHQRTPGFGPVSQLGMLVSGGGYAANAAGQARLGATGCVIIEDVSVNNTLGQGLLVEGKPREGALQLTLDNVRFHATCHYDPGLRDRASKNLAPITVTRASGIVTGGIRFSRCVVEDDRNRSFFSTGTSASHRNRGGLSDVQGSFVVTNPNSAGCTATLGNGTVDVSINVTECVKF